MGWFPLRSAEQSAGAAGAVQLPGGALEVEGSLQNPQKTEGAVQVGTCVSCLRKENVSASSPNGALVTCALKNVRLNNRNATETNEGIEYSTLSRNQRTEHVERGRRTF